MTDANDKRIIELCDAAIRERDSEKRTTMILEINELIEQRATEHLLRDKQAACNQST
jgi:hypothetical protein